MLEFQNIYFIHGNGVDFKVYISRIVTIPPYEIRFYAVFLVM
jgi:hypothetical protein